MSDNQDESALNTPRRHQQRVRNAFRERQVNQDLNSSPRRRRTIPSGRDDENRNYNDVFADDGRAPASSTGYRLQLPLIIDNGRIQRPSTPTPNAIRHPLQSVNNRSIGQRQRREREAAEKRSQIQPSATPLVSRRSAGQLRRQGARVGVQGTGLQTPPDTQASANRSGSANRNASVQSAALQSPQNPSNAQEPSRRALAQRARRERERRERENNLQTPTPPGRASTTPFATQPQGFFQPHRHQLLTPPATAVQREQASSNPQAHAAPNQFPENEEQVGSRCHERGFDPDYSQFLGTTGLFCAARRPYVEHVVERHDLGHMNYECVHCGALHWFKEKIADSSVSAPEFGKCCKHGQVRLPLLQRPPEYLHRLFTANDHQAREFRENIAQYNSALAFTSVGVSVDDSINRRGRGPPVFRIHGELKHLSGTLLPREGQAPAYAQLYILDPRAALQYRMHRNGNLQRDTMEGLQTLLTAVNPYSLIYQHAFEVLQQHPNAPDLTVCLRVMPGQDRRRYNLPTADEVAAIVPGDGTQAVDNRDIILRLRPDEHGLGALQRVNDGHAAYAPLHYVLLFPRGEPGWHWGLRLYQPDKVQPKRLTQTCYAAFRLHPRQGEFSTILHGGRLLQRYAVDLWASADQNRLNYLRKNQKKLRADLYQGLEDALARDVDLGNIGQQVILPSSYIGGPRHMYQRYQDAMAIARFFKKVDIFLTMTADPTWPEIARELLPGQTAADRPDLVSRVFKMKRDALLEDIRQVFGDIAGFRLQMQRSELKNRQAVLQRQISSWSIV